MQKKHIETQDKLFYEEKLTSDITRSAVGRLTTYRQDRKMTLTDDDGQQTTANILSRVTDIIKYSYNPTKYDLDGEWHVICRGALLVRFDGTQSVVDVPFRLSMSLASAGARSAVIAKASIMRDPKIMNPMSERRGHGGFTDNEINTDIYKSRQLFNQYRNALIKIAKSSLTWDADLVAISRF